MKIILIIAVFLLSFSLSNSASSQDSIKGKVYFIRSTGYSGSATSLNILIDKKLICKIHNKRFSIQEVEPGVHNFAIQGSGTNISEEALKQSIEIKVDAGKKYYIQVVLGQKMFSSSVYLQEIMESSSKLLLKDLEEQSNCL